jgi:hypothetical protein
MPRAKIIAAAMLACVLAACGGGNSNNGTAATATSTPAIATATPSSVPTNTAPAAPTSTATSAPAIATATPSSVPTNTAPAVATSTATSAPPVTATASSVPTATASEPPSIVDELNAAGVGRYLGITPASMMPRPGGEWDDYFYDPAAKQAICLRGDQYQVEVHHGTTNKVLLYLEGGGACWNNQTCWVTPLAKLTAVPLFGAGILLFDNPDNPFHDWNVVYAPYCDGSVFGGDNLADYDGKPTYHHGLQNVSAAVALMREQFPDPEQIVVAGSSAGGYGTYAGYGVTRVAYPDAPIAVIDDSGPGLQDPDDPVSSQERLDNWKYQQSIPASCTKCSTQLTYLTEWAIERDLTLRVGYFSNLRDSVIRGFLGLMPDAYESLLRTVTGDIRTRQPERFKRFFVQGESHTIYELPTFYTTEINGTSLRDWTADLLTDGPAWQDLIEGANPFKGFHSDRYDGESMWLCRPGLSNDQCTTNSLDATEVKPDNSLMVEPHTAATDPDYDCFYVYPTVDLTGTPGNHTDFSDISLELDPLLSQAAPFNSNCRVFAPLYRQVTIGTYLANDPHAAEYFAIAYGDVEEAFKVYMGQYNNGRNFVIMGHSQGTFMTTQLLQNLIDDQPELRARLIAAVLLGGSVTVPEGQTVDGTFQNLPLCTSNEQSGCVIAYRSYAADFPPTNGSNDAGAAGMDNACTNPAALGGGKAYFHKSILPLNANQPVFRVGVDVGLDITTPFALYSDFFTGECAKDEHGNSYLRVAVEPQSGDQRVNPINFSAPVLAPNFLGTHIIDYNWGLGDLIELVDQKATALRAAQSE